MKKVVSLLIACSLMVSTISVQAVSFNISNEDMGTNDSLESTPTPTTEVQGTENGIQTYSSIVADGYCGADGDGTNLTWTLYSDGELEIRGTGAMKDYKYTSGNVDTPWYSYRDSITKLQLSDGITSIGDYAFMTVLVYRGYCNI